MSLETRAPAKLNLCLYVGPRRPDGLHEIRSVFQPITLADTLTMTDVTTTDAPAPEKPVTTAQVAAEPPAPEPAPIEQRRMPAAEPAPVSGQRDPEVKPERILADERARVASAVQPFVVIANK